MSIASQTKSLALILAAGMGTRMKSRTPKVAHSVMGRPMLAWVVDAVRQAGAETILCVLGHGREAVQQALGEEAGGLTWILQEPQLGTGHAVMVAEEELRKHLPGRVLIVCGDTPLLTPATLSALLQKGSEAGTAGTVLSMFPPDPTGYGRVLRGDDGLFRAIVEDRDATPEQLDVREVNSGLYSFDLEALLEVLPRLSRDNDQGEYYLPDVCKLLIEDGRPVDVEVCADPREVLGINHRGQLAEAAAVLQGRINDGWMRAGVTLVDPATTYIDAGVVLSPDTTLDPCVRLRGTTRVASDCRIGQGSVLVDTTVEEGAVIRPYTVADRAHVGPGATVGPFSHLRPGARMAAGSRVGNFVEMKNTSLGEGSKANHLAYLGDAEIGPGTNIGAGTITCNYDGRNKNRTRLGRDVFIGSNSTLVAPIDIDDRAYVAAGSTVTKAIPSDALALGRARQVTKEGYRKLLDERAEYQKKKAEE